MAEAQSEFKRFSNTVLQGTVVTLTLDAMAVSQAQVKADHSSFFDSRGGDTPARSVEEVGPLICKSPDCGASPSFDAILARAYLEEMFRTEPAAKLRFTCRECSKTTSYTYPEILQLIPKSKRSTPLPENEFWAFVLLEIPTGEEMEDRVFFGEAVRIQLARREGGKWYGKALRSPRFLTGLSSDDLLVGDKQNNFHLCSGILRYNQLQELPLISKMPEGSSEFALFMLSKKDESAGLRTATLFCLNPSCYYPFKLTYNQFSEKSTVADHAMRAIEATGRMLFLTCPKCEMLRLINEQSFKGTVRM